jgi:hypothetical protein
MYASIWNKYFPVIKILMKKSAVSEQTLDFSSIDFEHIGKGRKAAYKFNIEFIDGKFNSNFTNNEFSASLIPLLMEDSTTKALLLQNNYEFSFNTKYQLSIKNTGAHSNSSKEEINVQEASSV